MELNLAWIHAEGGESLKARKILDGALKEKSKGYVRPTSVGLVWLALGETEEGFRWFSRAVEERDTGLLMIAGEPWYEKYMRLPGWKRVDDMIDLPKNETR